MKIENPDDDFIRKGMRRARNLRRIFWLICLWVAAWASICLEQVITNTDSMKALKIGAAVGVFVSPFMLIILVPAGLIGRHIGNWKALRPYRWWISLVLPLVLCCEPVVSSLRTRIDSNRSFEHYLDVKPPKDAFHFTAEIDNIILADLSATYSFECSRSETERLIRDLDLHEAELMSGITGRGTSVGGGRWKVSKSYNNYSDERYTGFIEMWTDETLTRVCVRKWNT